MFYLRLHFYLSYAGFPREGRGATPIGSLVYMCLPGLWVNLRYFALVMGHNLRIWPVYDSALQ